MSERVQLLLSDRILGMTLVPDGKVWNYGVGLSAVWSANIPYQVVLDTPLGFWAEQHRPAAFNTVCLTEFVPLHIDLLTGLLSSQVWRWMRGLTSKMLCPDLAIFPCLVFFVHPLARFAVILEMHLLLL
jgi:hypothetical protein